MVRDDSIFYQQLECGLVVDTNTIYIDLITAKTLRELIMQMNYLLEHHPKKNINLILASEGGDAYAMLGLIDFIKSLPVKVNTHCIGMALSAGAIILICGTGCRTMTKHSTIMLHEGSVDNVGKTTDVVSGLRHVKRLGQSVVELLAEHTKKDKKYWDDTLKSDKYYTSDEALKMGLVDKIK